MKSSICSIASIVWYTVHDATEHVKYGQIDVLEDEEVEWCLAFAEHEIALEGVDAYLGRVDGGKANMGRETNSP